MNWRKAVENAVALRRNKRGKQQDIRNFQDRRLREIVTHAYANVPYYRRLFDAHGLRPSDIRGIGDLEKIPVTRKADLKSLPLTDRLARGVNPRRLIAHTTAGSSGEPFTIYRSWLEERVTGLVRRRALEDYCARRGSLIVIATYNYLPKKNDHAWLDKLAGSLAGARLKGVFALDPPGQMLENFARMKPDIIGGYAGVLDKLAEYVEKHGLPFKPPFCILSGAEVLSDDARVRIRNAFQSPVYDTYGAHEFSRIAWECPQSGEYHRADDSVITEIRANGVQAPHGVEGSLIGTALHAYAMPFIRYELADTVTQGSAQCPCGAPFSTLLKIRVREVDYFVTDSGELVHPFILADALRPIAVRWVGQYQIVQESMTEVTMTGEVRHRPTPQETAQLIEAARGVLGRNVRFNINIVDELKPDSNGKHRIYRSKVTSRG